MVFQVKSKEFEQEMFSFIELFHIVSTYCVKFTSKGETKEVLIELLVKIDLLRILANIYLFKFNNRNLRKRCEICSKLTIKTPERCHNK